MAEPGAICCGVINIHGLETKSGKGWNIVVNIERLILAPHGNGPMMGQAPVGAKINALRCSRMP